jgi:LysM repeat protein
MPLPGVGKRLTLTRCDKSGATSGDPFTVMLNPSEVTQSRSISYSKTSATNANVTTTTFHTTDAEKLNFSIILDGTGVVPPTSPSATVKDVATLVKELCALAYAYDGTIHEPHRVQLLWGTLIFFGRLESMTTKYTLFKPSGDPLRAKVDLGLLSSVSKEEAVLTANRNSPDLSHVVEVRQGDTLPLLCKRIYGDPGYYLDVAQFNRLVDFRNLQPGRKLHFPPLE